MTLSYRIKHDNEFCTMRFHNKAGKIRHFNVSGSETNTKHEFWSG